MATRLFNLFIGCVFLFFGISGAVPSLVSHFPAQVGLPENHLIGMSGMLFSWLPVNTVHNVLYILLGLGACLSAFWFPLARIYCVALFWLALQFMVLGFLPWGINDLWGFMPLFGWNIMIHTVTAIMAWYFGLIYPLDWGGMREPQPA